MAREKFLAPSTSLPHRAAAAAGGAAAALASTVTDEAEAAGGGGAPPPLMHATSQSKPSCKPLPCVALVSWMLHCLQGGGEL